MVLNNQQKLKCHKTQPTNQEYAAFASVKSSLVWCALFVNLFI